MGYDGSGVFSLEFRFGSGTQNDVNYPVQVGSTLDDIATALNATTLATELVTNGALASNLTPASIGAAGTTQTDFISGIIANPTNQDYRIVEAIPYGATLTGLTAKLAAGTATVTLKINTTGVTGGAINATTTQQSSNLTGANVMATNNLLVITISAASATASMLSFTAKFTRTLAN